MAPDAAYWEASEACVECGGTDYSEGYSPRTLIFCDCCLDRGVHVECWHKRSGEQLTEERLASPAFQWCCGEVRRARRAVWWEAPQGRVAAQPRASAQPSPLATAHSALPGCWSPACRAAAASASGWWS